MRISPEIGSASIVLLGSFNPLIFHPSWFVKNNLIGDEEGEAAEIEVIHREIALFRLEWMTLKVEQHRLQAETDQTPFIRIYDLVVRAFTDCLSHTPVWALGINRQVHFSASSADTRNRIGKELAPHEPWGQWGPKLEGTDAANRGGLRTLVMEQRELEDRDHGHIQTKIEPSTKISLDGISMAVNDEFRIAKPAEASGCEEVMDILQRRFNESIRRSEWIIDQIMAKV